MVVQSTPVADLSVINQEGCYPSIVTFANESNGGDIVEWSYGNGVTSQTTDATHTFTYYNASSGLRLIQPCRRSAGSRLQHRRHGLD